MSLLRRFVSIAILASLAAFTGAGAAAEESAAPAAAPDGGAAAPAPVQLPPWMSVDVIKAAVAINMTDAQKPEFNKAVGEYVTDHFAMLQKESKRNNAANLDMTIKSKDKALVHKMDDEVEKILTKEQLPAYENYKKVLRAGLHP